MIWNAFCLGALASVLRDQERLTEAEPLFRRALKIMENTLPPDHADVEELRAEYRKLRALVDS